MALTHFEWNQFIGYLDIATLHTFPNKAKQNKSISLSIENDASSCVYPIFNIVCNVFYCIAFHCMGSHAIACINDTEDGRLPPMMIDECCQPPATISSSSSSPTLCHLTLPYIVAKAHVFFTLVSCQIA